MQINANEPQLIRNVTDDDFMVEVIEKSKELPVIVDFWAPWCGPCKSLTPLLESEAIKNKKSIILVKVNIDENKMIASQLRVQSIPAVFAFSDGQPVDGFMGAKTESEVKDFFEKIIGKFSKIQENPMENARIFLENGNYIEAQIIIKNIIEKNPSSEAFALLINSHLKLNQLEEIEIILNSIPENFLEENELKRAISSFKLIKNSSIDEKLDDLYLIVEQQPKNLSAKLSLSKVLFKENRFSESVDQLIKIFSVDREWEDGIAKKQLLMIFDHLGPENDITKKGRRALTSLIFN
tara:strand:- start:1125 stop:2009 length:885 start_codon:yes stop_codon:yes gene_type:complete